MHQYNVEWNESRMTKLRMKTNFIMIMVVSLLLVGSIGNITRNIELPEKDLADLQEQSLEALHDSENTPVREEIRKKVEGILTGYEEHVSIVINGNTNFNDTAIIVRSTINVFNFCCDFTPMFHIKSQIRKTSNLVVNVSYLFSSFTEYTD